MEDNPFFNGLITLAVGIVLAVFKRKYDQISEEKEKIKLAKKENKRKIIERLKEIELTLEKDISADHPKYKKIQNECLIFSNQLTSSLSQITGNLPDNVILDLKRLSSDLISLGNFPIYQGYNFIEDCKSIIESVKRIIREMDNYSNN
ncbi:hypothetical protein MSKOL_2075 [Methanosarcina sp. Kolksee]|uniref:DUF349 domain-containing protein n=1 Tax=Methanosarcina sp. Kolksee TaxID=1434099 RepID=UPI0006161134|nr:DUF349 domain-containing protein [Methanosarcina sp. Kolksee]AKB47852.1 hypothetical protein MSKOL_2075 [Methanosarcina sp. Kolksee]